MIRRSIGIFLSICLFASAGVAKTSKSQVNTFQELEKIVMGIASPQSTLLVMDDDDTLTMMRCADDPDPATCQYLGGPAWYDWQARIAGSGSPYSVADTQDELLKISTLLFAINKMDYTEADLASVLNRLSRSGVRLLIETARGGSNLSATEMQLQSLPVEGASYKNFLDMIRSNSLAMGPMNSPSLPGPFTPCGIPGSREVSYRQGVMYVAGQNKGVMLKCLLQYYEHDGSGHPALPVDHIVFIDDTQKNVDEVYLAFKDSTRYQMTALHYTALDSHKRALTEKGAAGAVLRDTAKTRWEAIYSTISQNLLSPAVGK